MDVKTATPVEIDTVIAGIYVRYYQAMSKATDLAARIERIKNTIDQYAGRAYQPYSQADVHAAETNAAAAFAAAAEVLAETRPYNQEFSRRGGWTRFWLVDNTGGHVHSSMHCNTCFPTTQFVWLPEFSGADEASVVEKAGESACTICFPSAPVDVLKRRSQIEAPARRAAREERERKAAERAAKQAAKAIPTVKITTQGSWTEKIETIAAARSRLTDHYQYTEHLHWKEFITAGLDDLVAAIATKEGKDAATVTAEARKRAAKRR